MSSVSVQTRSMVARERVDTGMKKAGKSQLVKADIPQLLKEQKCGIGMSGTCEQGSPYFQNWCTFNAEDNQCIFKSFTEIQALLPEMMDTIQNIARSGEILDQAKQQTIALQAEIDALKSEKEALKASAENDKAVILAKNQAETEEKINDMKEKWAAIAEFYLTQQMEIEGEIAQLQSRSMDFHRTYQQASQSLTSELEDLAEKKANMMREIAEEQAKHYGDMTSHKEMKARNTNQIRTLEAELHELEHQVQQKQAERNKVESVLKSLRDRESENLEMINKLDVEIGQKQGQSVQLSTQLTELQTKIQSEQQRLETQKEQTRSEIHQLQSEMNKLGLSEAEFQKKQAELAQKEADLAQSQSNRDALQAEVNQSVAELKEQQTALQEQKNQVAAQVAILNAELDQLRTEKQKLSVSLADELKSDESPISPSPNTIPSSSPPIQSAGSVSKTWDAIKIPLLVATICTLVYAFVINLQFTKQDPVTKQSETDWLRVGIAAAIFVGSAILTAILIAI